MKRLIKKLIDFYNYLKELNEYFYADYTNNDEIEKEVAE